MLECSWGMFDGYLSFLCLRFVYDSMALVECMNANCEFLNRNNKPALHKREWVSSS